MTNTTPEALRQALESAFDAGFRCAAGWAQRDDLFSDINSPTYKKDRQQYIAALSRAQAAPAVGVPDAAYKLGRNAGLDAAKDKVRIHTLGQPLVLAEKLTSVIESLKDNTP